MNTFGSGDFDEEPLVVPFTGVDSLILGIFTGEMRDGDASRDRFAGKKHPSKKRGVKKYQELKQ